MKSIKDKRYLKIQQIKLPKIYQRYMPIFDKKYLEQKTKISSLDNVSMKNKKLIIKFLFETGIRASELKTIIKINKDTIIVKGKGAKIREIFHNYQTTKLLAPFSETLKTLRL